GFYASMGIPILLAVVSTMRLSASTSVAFKSCIFVSAISFTLSRLTVAALFLFGSPEALLMPAACFKRTAAGGVLVTNVKERSSYTVISTGITVPACSCVRALNSLQNPIMLMPAWPSAGPTGGAGFALPAGIFNFTKSIYFFATRHTSLTSVMWFRSHASAPPTQLHLLLNVTALITKEF